MRKYVTYKPKEESQKNFRYQLVDRKISKKLVTDNKGIYLIKNYLGRIIGEDLVGKIMIL